MLAVSESNNPRIPLYRMLDKVEALGKLSVVLFCYFVYFFPFKAYGFEPRLLIFLLAFVVAVIHRDRIQYRKIPAFYVKLLAIPICIGLAAIVSLAVNGTSDIAFVIYPVQIVYLLLLSYLIFYIQKRLLGKTDMVTVIDLIIAVLLVQSLITVAMFLFAPINDFLFQLQGIDLRSKVIQMYVGKRLIGLGCFYFVGGIIYGFGLMLVVLRLLLKERVSRVESIVYVLIYCILFVVGICIARTCLVGAGLSVLLLCVNTLGRRQQRRVWNVLKKFFILIGILTVGLVSLYNMSPSFRDKYGAIIDFGFEMFFTFFEQGELSTASTESLKTLYVWPEKIDTYLIGDGRFTDGESYYMHTDVGYIRLIYYFGIGGLFLLMLQQFYCTGVLRRLSGNRYVRSFSWLLFLYALLLNLKGYIDFSTFVFILAISAYSDFAGKRLLQSE